MTTKKQERDALNQIIAIIDALGCDSYVATAFQGCAKDALRNIEEDAAYSYADRYSKLESKHQALVEENLSLVKKLDALTKKVEDLKQCMLSDDDIAGIRAVLNGKLIEDEKLLEEYAKSIVENATNPTSVEFERAVRDHRSILERINHEKALIKRVYNVYSNDR